MPSIRPTFSLLASLALAGSGLACGTSADDDDSGSRVDDDDTSDASDLFAVQGLWLQPDGAPIEGIAVSVSTEFCIADITDAGGGFRVEDVSPGPKRLITYGSTAGFRWPSVVFAFEAADDGADFSFAGALHLPALDEGVPVHLDALAPQTVVLATGLQLTFEPASIDLAPLAAPLLRSGSLPPEDANFFADLPPGAIQVFGVEPILTTFDPPAGVTVDVADAAPGQRLGLWSIAYDTGIFVQEGTLVVDDGGVARTDSGGLSHLGWHAIAPLELP